MRTGCAEAHGECGDTRHGAPSHTSSARNAGVDSGERDALPSLSRARAGARRTSSGSWKTLCGDRDVRCDTGVLRRRRCGCGGGEAMDGSASISVGSTYDALTDDGGDAARGVDRRTRAFFEGGEGGEDGEGEGDGEGSSERSAARGLSRGADRRRRFVDAAFMERAVLRAAGTAPFEPAVRGLRCPARLCGAALSSPSLVRTSASPRPWLSSLRRSCTRRTWRT